MTGLAQILFPWRANGSLVTNEKGQVVGSELIAQGFANPAYLQPRPSAAGEKGYDAASSSGSNLGSTSKKLQDRIKEDLKRLKEENPDASGPVPGDLVTASGSGLDPHVSPQGALWQVPRIAKARGISPERVQSVVTANVEGRTFGILGEPRVNVLLVNLALDRQFGRPASLPAHVPLSSLPRDGRDGGGAVKKIAVVLRHSSGRTAKYLKLDTQKSVRGEALEL
jgi:K+-transporting ATPase ATPase C chain